MSRLGHEVSFLAIDSTLNDETEQISVLPESYNGYPVWRLKFAASKRAKRAFDTAYDPEMGKIVHDLLAAQKTELLIILNFYMLSLASVEAAKSRNIPVIHIGTDFVPICRRATFIRWNGEPCQVGESVKTCTECFVSHRLPGKLAAGVLNRMFSERTLIRLAQKRQTFPLKIMRPYWEQVALMETRLETIQPLRKKIDLVLTPTRFTSEIFIANGFRPEQVHFLPFGVDGENTLGNLTHHPAPHLRFLFIGRFQPYKGLHLLVKAFNQLENPQSATLTIYGKPDGYDDYFHQLKKEIAANARIHFAGTIPPDELGSAFSEADYFLLPSLWHENNPLILLDALQSNTPVIASEVGGVRDLVKDGRNGFLFPMGDVQALQRVLQKTIDSPKLKDQLKAGGNLISIDEYARTMLHLYTDSLSRPAGREGVPVA